MQTLYIIRRTLTAQAAVLIALALLTAQGGFAQAPEYAVLRQLQFRNLPTSLHQRSRPHSDRPLQSILWVSQAS